jgi:hypothetical protein
MGRLPKVHFDNDKFMGHVFGGLAVNYFIDNCSGRKSIGSFTKSQVYPEVKVKTAIAGRKKKDGIGGWRRRHD